MLYNKNKKSTNKINMKKTLLLISVIGLFAGGCRPYEKPIYEEAQSFQTPFVIPLEGDLSNQARFDSAAQLEKMKVAVRRIPIPRRWKQTGRAWWSGEYIPTVQVIKVDRTPVTVEWIPI